MLELLYKEIPLPRWLRLTLGIIIGPVWVVSLLVCIPFLVVTYAQELWPVHPKLAETMMMFGLLFGVAAMLVPTIIFGSTTSMPEPDKIKCPSCGRKFVEAE